MVQEEAARQEAVTDGVSPVPSLVTLCLQAIARHLKHFCNLRLHNAVCEALSATERQLIQTYDLSRLDLFEAQGFLPLIAAWRSRAQCKKAEAFRLHSFYRIHPSEIPRAQALSAYVLLPPASQQSGDPLCNLKTARDDLGFEQVSQTELRVTETPASAPQGRPEWVYGVTADTTDSQMAFELASKLNLESPEGESPSDTSKVLSGSDEIIRFRSPVTNVGCGIVASLLRSYATLVRLRLNSCQITDAGAILLASAVRTTSTLRLLDLSNDPFPSRRDLPMDNVIGSVGTRTIALALEQNRSVEYVDLSGNPVREDGALSLAKMISKNATLRSLGLERTHVGDAADSLIDAFESSPSLKSLNLRWCALRPGLGIRLAAVHGNKHSVKAASSCIRAHPANAMKFALLQAQSPLDPNAYRVTMEVSL